ncbi:hypothetical protein ACWF95_25295 [Streptomyces vinaceus]
MAGRRYAVGQAVFDRNAMLVQEFVDQTLAIAQPTAVVPTPRAAPVTPAPVSGHC